MADPFTVPLPLKKFTPAPQPASAAVSSMFPGSWHRLERHEKLRSLPLNTNATLWPRPSSHLPHNINPVKPLNLYVDASTVGGYYDEEFKTATGELWKQWRAGLYHFRASILVETELQRAPARVRGLFLKTFDPFDLLPLTDEADELADLYMNQQVVPVKYYDDARHVAIAVTHAIPYIVSWNFKHLVNVQREAGFNAVNVLHGYPQVRIVSPLEL